MDLRKVCDIIKFNRTISHRKVQDSLDKIVNLSFGIGSAQDSILCHAEEVPEYRLEIEQLAQEAGVEPSYEEATVQFNSLVKSSGNEKSGYDDFTFVSVKDISASDLLSCPTDLPIVPSDFEYPYYVLLQANDEINLFFAVKDGQFFYSHTRDHVVQNVGEDTDIYVCKADSYIFIKDLYDLSSAVISNSNLYDWVYRAGWVDFDSEKVGAFDCSDGKIISKEKQSIRRITLVSFSFLTCLATSQNLK